MGYLDKIADFTTRAYHKVTGPKKSEQSEKTQQSKPAEQTQAADSKLTVDMSELEVKAEMNKAMGFVKSTHNQEVDYAAIDKNFATDPFGFANEHLSAEVKETAVLASTDFDINATVLRTFTPERQEQVIAGFSQRNESPNAFTGEFLDIFAA